MEYLLENIKTKQRITVDFGTDNLVVGDKMKTQKVRTEINEEIEEDKTFFRAKQEFDIIVEQIVFVHNKGVWIPDRHYGWEKYRTAYFNNEKPDYNHCDLDEHFLSEAYWNIDEGKYTVINKELDKFKVIRVFEDRSVSIGGGYADMPA